MPDNSIEASVEFSFKGEDYRCASVIDLDQLLLRHDEMPQIHAILAREHGIDTYSYLYEVMQEVDIEFSHPKGYAVDFLNDGQINQEKIAANWQDAKAAVLLKPIAENELGILDLNLHPELKRALVRAYHLGRNT
jgi:hypothetical protein